MTTIRYAKRFVKQFQKITPKQQEKFYSRLALLEKDPANEQLHNHSLKGRFSGYYSINVGGDLRALYHVEDGQIIIFQLIGTHSQLYCPDGF